MDNIFETMSIMEGSYDTIWGPCTDGTKDPCTCPQCQNANSIVNAGKNWDEEYDKAEKRNFDRSL